MNIKFKNSPNFEERPKNTLINTIILHHTNMIDAESAITRLCNPESKVSCHYLINKNGDITQLVPIKYRAWHAGKSYWRGKEGINDNSIGIELDNTGNELFPLTQVNNLIELCKELQGIYPIEPRNIIAHYDIAPDRKDDPNHHFNWQFLAKNGIGLFPTIQTNNAADRLSSIKEIQYKLKLYGYKIDVTGNLDPMTKAVIIAFKRHFCPECFFTEEVDKWDFEAESKLNELLRMIDEKK